MVANTDFRAPFQRNVTSAFRELLSEKHLYQSSRVDCAFIDEVAKALHEEARLRAAAPRIGGSAPHVAKWETFRRDGLAMMQMTWIPDAGIVYPEGSWQAAAAKAGHIENTIQFKLPTIQTRCPHCKGRWPFNPMEADRKWEMSRQSSAVQWFFLSYECQNCKGEPVRFLIRRTREKLTLCGRDPIEAVEVPTVIPKDHAPRFSGSIVAYQSGQTLAAIFLLRVFVEQFWRSIPEVMDAVKGKTRPTGDEIGDAYKATLPADFRGRFPTLCEVYDELSAAIHSADETPEIYTAACEKVIEHFDARRMFKLNKA